MERFQEDKERFLEEIRRHLEEIRNKFPSHPSMPTLSYDHAGIIMTPSHPSSMTETKLNPSQTPLQIREGPCR